MRNPGSEAARNAASPNGAVLKKWMTALVNPRRNVHRVRSHACGLRGIVARIHYDGQGFSEQQSCGLRGIVARIHWTRLCLVPRLRCGLRGIVARIHFVADAVAVQICCGLRGIVARIHWRDAVERPTDAVACGESSLGYTR